MRSLVVVAAVVVCSACSAPAKCEHLAPFVVFADAGASTLGVVGQPLPFVTQAPLTACPGDVLRATVDLIGPDNLSRPSQTLTPTLDPNDRLVIASFSVTPDQPGPWLLHVTFEPSLGVRTFAFDAVISHVDATGPAVSTADCLEAPWPVDAKTIACATASARIEVRTVDGARWSFPGERLVVAEDVLWSIEGTGSALERRVVDDAGVHLTHRFDGFIPTALMGLHRRDSALRTTSSGFLAVARTDGGVEVSTRLASTLPMYGVFFDEPQGIAHGLGCDALEDLCIPDFLGLEDEVVWTTPPPRAFTRPWAAQRTARFSTALLPEAPLLTPGGFARFPARFSAPNRDQVLLSSSTGGQLHLSLWSRARLLRVGHHFATVQDPSDSTVVHVVPITD